MPLIPDCVKKKKNELNIENYIYSTKLKYVRTVSYKKNCSVVHHTKEVGVSPLKNE